MLEIGKLRDFLAVEPDFPAEAPGAERGRLPIVFHKTDVVRERVNAERVQAVEIKFLRILRRGLQDQWNRIAENT